MGQNVENVRPKHNTKQAQQIEDRGNGGICHGVVRKAMYNADSTSIPNTNTKHQNAQCEFACLERDSMRK